MVGRYQMQNPTGNTFEVDIPAFSLDVPEQRRTLN
jgi:ApaG protein